MLLFATNTGFAQQVTEEFKVMGNCNGCKKRIEKTALTVDGVSSVNWDKETKMIQVSMAEQVSIVDVATAIEAIGHDTEFNKADVTVYNDLPGCCQYDRGDDASEVAASNAVASFSFSVSGKCGMCKKRIEKAAKSVAGVTSAVWGKESKIITIGVSDASTTEAMVSDAIIAVGHDTKFSKAKLETYENLPGCCHYDRVQ
tara:strand:- start:378 stop:977 length:600 start_codon:yes stop_codon:yes gene_type:complete